MRRRGLEPAPAPTALPVPARVTARSSRRRTGPFLALVVLAPLALYLLVLLVLDRTSCLLVAPALLAARRILWVIAHPDDESLFFAPSILILLARPSATGHLLSLSTGDNEGMGAVRKAEMTTSCASLGIDQERCLALDVPAFPDDPKVWWAEAAIEETVRVYVQQWNIDLIITFDDYGVSGHSNHRALCSALTQAHLSTTAFPPVYTLSSTPLLAKFTSLWSFPYSLLGKLLGEPRSLFVATPAQYGRARRSFEAHASQSRWFRSLFMLFSRYLWFVELAPAL